MSNHLLIDGVQHEIPCDTAHVSDGYHTFGELYEHRCLLFIALLSNTPRCLPWRAHKHPDGSMYQGWFIAGMTLPTGMITYHLPLKYWNLLSPYPVVTYETAPAWDGHTSRDVLARLEQWITNYA